MDRALFAEKGGIGTRGRYLSLGGIATAVHVR